MAVLSKLRPSDILFSVAVVDNKFHKYSNHRYLPIGETLDLLCEGKTKISDIPKISVVKRKSEWITINNRRLWIFRQMERLGKCKTITVNATDEISLPCGCPAFKNADVREDPGGLCYQLPSCKKKDPISNLIWGTYAHIKENMFPHPNRRVIITIFQNLVTENQRGDETSSKGRTLSSGYLEVRLGGFNVSQIDYVQKKLRTRQWIMEQGVSKSCLECDRSRMFTALAIEQLPRHVYLPKIYHVPGGSLQLNPRIEIDSLSVITTISQQGSLSDDTLQIGEMLSAASCQTSGYIFVTGANNYEQSCVSDELDSEINDVNVDDKQTENGKTQTNRHPHDITEARKTDPSETARDIIHGVENILSKTSKEPTEFSKHIPEIQNFIESAIQRKFEINNQTYENEIDHLKSDIDNLVSTKNEDIENLRQELSAAKRALQEQQMKFELAFTQDSTSGVRANTQASGVSGTLIQDERRTTDAVCMIGISLSEDQRSSEFSSRRRTESERTITEANEHVDNSEIREPVQCVYGNNEIDIDFDIAWRDDTNSSSDGYRSEDNLFRRIFWGYYD